MPRGKESPLMPKAASKAPKAVALRYDDSLPAPFLVAKGAGAVAERIKSMAADLGIPVLQDDDLAGFLFPLDPGQMVPELYWEIVAKVYVFIAELERR
jgi:type III secretion system FlhB-like substrate exporter